VKTALLDKISSVTRNAQLKREVRIGSEIPCEEGVVIAARVLTDKSTYNQVELPNGRMAQVKRGDVVAGCLGHRHALFGYSGRIPERLAPGDRIHLLNLGGVMGICDGVHPDLGAPFECEVLGSVLSFPVLGERIARPARIGNGQVLPDSEMPPLELHGVPVVAVMGSCMNAGKTAAAVALTRELAHRGLTIDGAKATGVSLRRDILALEDAGARTTAIFTDFGIVSTGPANAAQVTRKLLAKLAAERPDLILLELGDGLLGAYGVDAILADRELVASFTATVFAANDPVAAWGGVELLRREYGFAPTVVTGPATDNKAGAELIERKVGVPAANARTSPERLTDLVDAALTRAGHPVAVGAAG
jgi:hypothetical protein